MFTQQIKSTFGQFVAPAIEINKIALGYTEKLVELNLTLLRKQADVALASWRGALSVKDPEQVKDYLFQQGEVARDMVNGYVADAKTVTEMNREVANDVRKVVVSTLAEAAEKAA